jgi:DNA-dependent RNA polymerase auxiliary subunit epsilon
LELGARKLMIFKVYYQESITEVPVREKTKTMYVEANLEREVRAKLADRGLNIEFVELVRDAYLEYERQNEDFKVLEIG